MDIPFSVVFTRDLTFFPFLFLKITQMPIPCWNFGRSAFAKVNYTWCSGFWVHGSPFIFTFHKKFASFFCFKNTNFVSQNSKKSRFLPRWSQHYPHITYVIQGNKAFFGNKTCILRQPIRWCVDSRRLVLC